MQQTTNTKNAFFSIKFRNLHNFILCKTLSRCWYSCYTPCFYRIPMLKLPTSPEAETFHFPPELLASDVESVGPCVPSTQISGPYPVLPPIARVNGSDTELSSDRDQQLNPIHRSSSEGYLTQMEKHRQLKAKANYKVCILVFICLVQHLFSLYFLENTVIKFREQQRQPVRKCGTKKDSKGKKRRCFSHCYCDLIHSSFGLFHSLPTLVSFLVITLSSGVFQKN